MLSCCRTPYRRHYATIVQNVVAMNAAEVHLPGNTILITREKEFVSLFATYGNGIVLPISISLPLRYRGSAAVVSVALLVLGLAMPGSA